MWLGISALMLHHLYLYRRVKALLDEEEANQLLRDMYPHVMEVFG